MERKQTIRKGLILSVLIVSSLGLRAQDSLKVNYWYKRNYVEGQLAKDSCLYSVEFFTPDSLPTQTNRYGPCSPDPGYTEYHRAGDLIIGESHQSVSGKLSYRYLWIEGRLERKIGSDYHPTAPFFVVYKRNDKGEITEEQWMNAVKEPAVPVSKVRINPMKSGRQRVYYSPDNEVLYMEDETTDAQGLLLEIRHRLPGAAHPEYRIRRHNP
jgi:hypothetical protein